MPIVSARRMAFRLPFSRFSCSSNRASYAHAATWSFYTASPNRRAGGGLEVLEFDRDEADRKCAGTHLRSAARTRRQTSATASKRRSVSAEKPSFNSFGMSTVGRT
jgi:hypothetical protein